MNALLVLGMALLLASCSIPMRSEPSVLIAPTEIYTKPEIDAINTETQCKAMARSMVQIARCEVRR